MTLRKGVRLRDATDEDVPGIAALRLAAGWGVHDWALRAVLAGPHARCVLAVANDGGLVGVGSAISYGAFGVVGNMVVDAGHRRQGIGAAILEAVLAFLAERGVGRIELSATDAGRPLYARHGFVTDGPGLSAVVSRDLPALDEGGAGADLLELGSEAADELAAYDAPRFGGDRTPLLTAMLDDPGRPVVAARRGGAMAGWGWVRPDAERLGPLLADSPATALAIVAEAFRRMPGAQTLRLNMPATNRLGGDALREAGATFETWGGRMARGPTVPRRDDTIYANAVGALG